MTFSGVTGNANAGKAARGDDFNASPYEALPPLLMAEGRRLPRTLWEPYAGNGALVVPLRNRKFAVTATDLVARGCPDSTGGVDFLEPGAVEHAPAAPFGICSNPPFEAVEAHIETATERAPYVAFLLRFSFLESEGRDGWWARVGLRRVHLIVERLPMMHRDGYEGKKLDKSGMAFAWFIFERGTGRRAQLQVPVRWVSYKRACRRFPMRPWDVPPAAVPAVQPLLAWGARNG